MTSDFSRMARTASFFLVAAAMVFGVAPSASAEPGFGDWVNGHASRARLVVGAKLAPGEYLAGVQIQLDPGWHTYWRNPGDSGVPPSFDWSQSVNVAQAEVEWPAPISIPDAFGTSIGYLDEVVFPVVVKPENMDDRTTLRLTLDHAVCREICVPLSSELSTELEAGDTPSARAIALVNSYQQLVPRRQGVGEKLEPEIAGASSRRDGDRVVLVVEASSATPADMYVEGPSRFFFPAASGVADGGQGNTRFVIEVEGAKSPGDLVGAELTATLVSSRGSVEHSWTAE